MDTFRTLMACMPTALRTLLYEMDGMFLVVFPHDWTRAEATENLREAIEEVDCYPRVKLQAQRIHPAQTVESRKIAVGRAEVQSVLDGKGCQMGVGDQFRPTAEPD